MLQLQECADNRRVSNSLFTSHTLSIKPFSISTYAHKETHRQYRVCCFLPGRSGQSISLPARQPVRYQPKTGKSGKSPSTYAHKVTHRQDRVCCFLPWRSGQSVSLPARQPVSLPASRRNLSASLPAFKPASLQACKPANPSAYQPASL
jgi:hypothetical protein